MAKPIQPTPILKGKDAWDFVKEVATSEATPEEKKEFKSLLKKYRDLGSPFD